MATTFPTTLDGFTNPTSTSHLDEPGVDHASQHANVNDSVAAIEAKLGTNLSNTATSIDYIANLFLLTQTEHPSGTYREIEYTSSVFPLRTTWYVDSGKTIKLVQKELTYGGTISVIPSVIVLRLYRGTGANVVARTITDTITYDGVLEISRTRIVS